MPESPNPPAARRRALTALCVTEIVSWGVLYYAFPVVLGPLTRATGWSTGSALGAFSTAAMVSAAATVPVGRLLERHGPRPVMTGGSAIALPALVAVAVAPTLPALIAAWAAVGVAMAGVLYPPAFSALTVWYGPDRVRAITTLSLVAGVSSTIFAPITAEIVSAVGWRATYVILAALLASLTVPLHAIFLALPWPASRPARGRPRTQPAVRAATRSRGFLLLSLTLMLAAFSLYGASFDLVPLLTARGIGNTLAATTLALVGVGQLLGRTGYPSLTRRTSPRVRTSAVAGASALAVASLAAIPPSPSLLLAVAIAVGGCRGAYTLVQATAISDRWGIHHYPVLNGIGTAPATAAMAIAPAVTALLARELHSYTRAYYLLALLLLASAATALGADRTATMITSATRRR